MADKPILQISQLSKRFGPVRALHEINMQVQPGTVHSVLGANGSGKSTLIKILAGYHTPDDGAEIQVRGQRVSLPVSPGHCGIAIVHQDLGLLEDATVLENVGISSSYGAVMGSIRWRTERRRTRAILERLGSSVSLDTRVGDLQPADRTIVGIARALRQIDQEGVSDPILLLDEPTVTLPRPEVDRLFSVMRDVGRAGGSVIFVTHRLKEALAISDWVTVFRDGALVRTQTAKGVSVPDLVRAMHGVAAEAIVSGQAAQAPRERASQPVFEVTGLQGPGIEEFSVSLSPGDIVGVTGLAGMGQDEVPYLLVGAASRSGGQVRLAGRTLDRATPQRAWSRGIALVPANRAQQSIWLDGSLVENFTIVNLRRYFSGGWLRKRRELDDAAGAIDRYAVKAQGPGARIGTLSGGNQQKLIIGRALVQQPRVLLLHEPFIGIDAAARAAVLDLIAATAADGCAVAIFSIEYELLAGVCDRILIMAGGWLAAELPSDGLTEAAIAEAAQQTAGEVSADTRPQRMESAL